MAENNFYFEGDDDSASSSAQKTETSEKNKTYAKRQSSEMPTIDEIAERLEITETTAPDKFDEKVRDEANPFFYEMWGLKELQPPTEKDRERIREWKDALTKKADDEWGRTKGELLNNFNRSLNVLYQNISNQTMYERDFEPRYKKNLWRDFSVEIKARGADKIVDVFEMCELLDWAKERNLWKDETTKKEVTSQIEEAVKANGAGVESWEDTFIRLARQKSATEMLGTENNKRLLLAEYKKCLSASDLSRKQDDDTSLMRDMENTLDKFGMKFSDKLESFKTNYFYKTVVEKRIDLTKPLSAETYYEMQIVARNEYGMSDAEWKKFEKENGIIMAEDAASAEMKNRIKTLEKEKKKIEAEKEKSEAEHKKEIKNMAMKSAVINQNTPKAKKRITIKKVLIILAVAFITIRFIIPTIYEIFEDPIDATMIKVSIKLNKERKFRDDVLYQAVTYNLPKVAKVLIDAGANLNYRNSRGKTALMEASRRDGSVQQEIAKMLVEAGADLNLRDTDGETALMYASDNGRLEMVKLLVEVGADLDLQNRHSRTALILASDKGHLEVVKLLVEAGADINVKDSYRETALDKASNAHHTEIVNFLKQHGAK